MRRAGFVLMASLAVYDRKAGNENAGEGKLLPVINEYANDPRNFVKRAVNWALRRIGKRNSMLKAAAMVKALELAKDNNGTKRWVGSNALRESKRKAGR